MDFDNDGILDFISGSYDPGDLYLFRGLGAGKYAAVEQILDSNGLSLVHHPKEFAEWNKLEPAQQQSGEMDTIMLRVATFGSWPAAVDWDDDGDLDILIGSFAGDLFLRTNVGTRSEPKFEGGAIQVHAGGEPLHVNHHAAPVVADWNEDGLWDLVVGSGDGAVGWFANVGTKQAPEFGEYQQLIAPGADSKFYMQYLEEGDQPQLGVRAQICVTDYDQDGRLDLIVGDYSDIHWLRDLNEQEKKEQAEVRALVEAAMAESAKVQKKYAKMYEDGDYDDEQYQAEMKKFSEQYGELEKRSKEFVKETRSASFVWLLRRRADEASPTVAKRIPASNAESPTAPPASKEGDQSSTGQLSMVTVVEPVKGSSNTFRIQVEVLIQPGWHLYSKVPKGGAHRAATLKLVLPESVRAVGKWKRPQGLPSSESPKEKIYTGLVRFTRKIEVDDPSLARRLEVVLDYEVCKQTFCLPPAKLRQAVEFGGE